MNPKALLFVPANVPRYIERAKQTKQGIIVILDLEDAVLLEEKEKARAGIMQTITELHQAGKTVFVRINDPLTSMGIEDLITVAQARPQAVVVPKATEKRMEMTSALLSVYEGERNEEHKTGVVALIETAYGVQNAAEIVKAGGRTTGLLFGALDYANDLGIDEAFSQEVCDFARNVIVNVAKVAQVEAYDSPCFHFQAPEACQIESLHAKRLGFSGKAAIHPSAVSHIYEAFQPSQQQQEWARGVVESYEKAKLEGRGSCVWQGKMVDGPAVSLAQSILAQSIEEESYAASHTRID